MLFWRHPSSCGSFFNSYLQKLVPNALLAAPYPFRGGSFFNWYWKLIPNGLLVFLLLSWFLCQILLWWPSSSCGGFLFNSYWKLISNALLAALLSSWRLLIQFLLKTDAQCSSGAPPPLAAVSYTLLIENVCQYFLWRPSSFASFLYNDYWTTDAKYSSGGPPPLVVVS